MTVENPLLQFNPALFSRGSSRINASQIRKVFDLAAQRKDPINLSIGQPDFPVPPEVKQAMITAIEQNQTAYTQTQGLYSLRERLAQKLQEENGIRSWSGHDLSPEEIMVSPGVSASLYLLFSIFINPGDEIILVDPYFLMYEGLANYFQAKIHFVRETHLLEDLEKVAHEKIKFFLFSSPSNPTGNIFDEQTLKSIVPVLERYGILAIADEIYEKFDFEKAHVSLASFYPRTITLNGFSKSYALTGMRLGYAAAPRDVVEKMATIQQYTFVCAPQPTQQAGLRAVSVDLSHHIQDYKERRDLIYGLLKDHFTIHKPSGAFYIFPWLKNAGPDTSQKFSQRAVEENVLIVPGNIFTQRPGGFRISFATSREKLEAGAKILVQLANEFA